MMNSFIVFSIVDWCMDSMERSIDCRLAPPPNIVAGAIIDWIEIDGLMCVNQGLIVVDDIYIYSSYIIVTKNGKYGRLSNNRIGRISWHL